jgi:hypothetical protein
MDMNKVPPKMRPKKLGGARAGTLVVCPVIALTQWKSEIEKFTEVGTFSVGIYHGPNRAKEMPAEMMRTYDVVLTTYQVLEQDYRKMVSPNKVTCPNCGGKFKIEKLTVHLKYFCGESARRTEAQSRQRRTGANRSSEGRGGGENKRGANSKKNPPSKNAKASIKSQTPPKKVESGRKTIQVHRTATYDSDTELSVGDACADTVYRGRPSRSAAIKASEKVAISLKDWKQGDDQSDESSFASSSSHGTSNVDDTSSTDLPVYKGPRAPVVKAVKKKGQSIPGLAAERAREKQREALEEVTISKAKRIKPKSPVSEGREKGKANPTLDRALEKQREALNVAKNSKKFSKVKHPAVKGKGRGKGRKHFDGSSVSSGDESEDRMRKDPLDGIDMDERLEEAMAGARFSPLHSFCWWRVSSMLLAIGPQFYTLAHKITCLYQGLPG